MYDLVQEFWKQEIERLETSRGNASQQEVQVLDRKIKWIERNRDGSCGITGAE